MTHYIFGYGSLMNSASRRLTGQTSQAEPATVTGLKRYWGKVDDSYILSPLVVDKGHGKVNGVLLAVSDKGLEEFDVRERGYHRILIESNDIKSLVQFDQNDRVWVYVKDSPEPPCSLSPIMQTYVDTVLAGCLEISEQFAKEFIEHTIGWHFPLENDRHQPKYGNLAGVKPEHHNTIDALVAEARS
ncbi:gamma-glutamylcyclotransferase family protein [Vibrio sp. TBV020]|uniref:gamma-glutamylcyclotransferase family protein n=1 Tax=Vibrio sp. TBV020 TaxID=3137398 RepID=UPI0038CD7B04